MKNQTNKARAALPTGMVVVDKGGVSREIIVGILNGTRMPAHGFDVRGFAPNHYRVVNHGPFGIILGTRVPIEVRVIVDGETVSEQKFVPTQIPLQLGMDPTLTEARAELPQPFMILHSADGRPLMFQPYDSSLSADEIIAQQLHAQRMEPPALEMIDHGAPVTDELKLDITEEMLAAIMRPQAPATPDNATTDERAATQDGDEQLADEVQGPPQGKDNLPADMPAFADVYRDGDSQVEAPLPPQHEVIDTTRRSKSWAPSHGLVAVGVRIMQETPEGELPTPPDAFTYVLFQMNPWDVHVKAMAALQGRVILPSKDSLKAIMEQEGFAHELGTQHEVHCGGISCDRHRR